ncbi:LacI family DNA-binding transcriptional regulator [Stakelama sp. CBK3Z-3]|uniref:LacI family DNA-binding transcriptional regulator n=1 Tax=Stakelama flava TaxID=2860338 RepID=A0ABS6XN21_9SPHN|nr:LacI family DNA-binding transcriptional regulator [Stakelama flava]MBW4331592.1 LacI family DNA-binding transcriptional regulator [Stakelama flava]
MATTRQRRRGSGANGAPTIADVARVAGVSAMTVSRVINAETNVRASTREAVKAAIAQLNYQPNSAARTLAGAMKRRIGLLYSNPSANYLSEFLVGSLEQASRSDVQLVVEKCELGDHELEVARHLINSGIDALLLPPPLCDSPALLELVQARGIPFVLVGTGQPDGALNTVRIDDFAAARAMTDHILALGHRRIGFIKGNSALSVSALRLEGYCAALEAAGVARDESLIVQGHFTYRSGLDGAEELLDADNPPTAIFAGNDDMAAATVAVAHRRGLDVPGDLTVCGFDDTTLATAIWPELTTICQPIAEMARAAVDLLVRMLGGNGDDTQGNKLQLNFDLIRRQSDAAPRRRPSSGRSR